jgi:hypothetical protein
MREDSKSAPWPAAKPSTSEGWGFSMRANWASIARRTKSHFFDNPSNRAMDGVTGATHRRRASVASYPNAVAADRVDWVRTRLHTGRSCQAATSLTSPGRKRR